MESYDTVDLQSNNCVGPIVDKKDRLLYESDFRTWWNGLQICPDLSQRAVECDVNIGVGHLCDSVPKSPLVSWQRVQYRGDARPYHHANKQRHHTEKQANDHPAN